MKLRQKVGAWLVIYSAFAFILLLVGVGLEVAFGLTIKMPKIFFTHSFTTIPLVGTILIYPRMIFFCIAILIPLLTAMIGVENDFEIWKEWYFWILTAGCVAYMFYFLLNTTNEGLTSRSDQRR